ncbi:MAG: hydrogenase maturation protease, partial [Planctomycetales bacterium]|nr:hydrogenase maturation protease [Planctomycetales bacterium]
MSESDLTRPILVIGLGNTLRGDDALGRLAAERLRQRVDPQRVAVIDLISPTPELAAEIAGADLVVFLDASIIGPVRQVVVQRLKAQDNDESLMHQCQPASLVRLAEE